MFVLKVPFRPGRDLVGIAKTGSGKTLAFSLPGMIHLKHQVITAGRNTWDKSWMVLQVLAMPACTQRPAAIPGRARAVRPLGEINNSKVTKINLY